MRNLQDVHVLYADQLNTYDVLVSDDVVFTKAAFEAFVADKAKERGGLQVSVTTIKDPRDVVLAPVVSEKSYGLIDEGKYTFLVDPRSNKTEIKLAVEKIFSVKVDSINTINRAGKRKRTKFGWGTAQEHQACNCHPQRRHDRHLRRSARVAETTLTRK